ncbi:MAG: hypothetical protein LC772_09080 [Chloroflexi bacterium]|nr:hypothetical protein [Chloroflexota bacterium]
MAEAKRNATDKRGLTWLSAGVDMIASRSTCGECAFLTFCPQNLGREPADFVQESDIACTIFVRKLPDAMSTLALRAKRTMPEPGGREPGLPVMKSSGKLEGETA